MLCWINRALRRRYEVPGLILSPFHEKASRCQVFCVNLSPSFSRPQEPTTGGFVGPIKRVLTRQIALIRCLPHVACGSSLKNCLDVSLDQSDQ
jgi:hypothetical protein